MRIEGKMTGDLVALQIKSRDNAKPGEDTRGCWAEVDFGFHVESAATFLGKDFETLAFGSVCVDQDQDGNEIRRFLVDRFKPGKAVVFEVHDIRLEGETIRAQPKMQSITTIQGDDAVVARLRIPISVEEPELIKQLVDQVGEVITVEFAPIQQTLPLDRVSRDTPGSPDAPESQADAG